MEKKEILRRLVSIYSDVTVMDEEDVDSDSPMFEITDYENSLDDFASAVFDEFDIEIDYELANDEFGDLGDVVKYIHRRLN